MLRVAARIFILAALAPLLGACYLVSTELLSSETAEPLPFAQSAWVGHPEAGKLGQGRRQPDAILRFERAGTGNDYVAIDDGKTVDCTLRGMRLQGEIYLLQCFSEAKATGVLLLVEVTPEKLSLLWPDLDAARQNASATGVSLDEAGVSLAGDAAAMMIFLRQQAALPYIAYPYLQPAP